MQFRTFPGMFDPRCSASTVIFNRETIPSPTGIACKPCLVAQGDTPGICCRTCFNAEWGGISVSGTDSTAPFNFYTWNSIPYLCPATILFAHISASGGVCQYGHVANYNYCGGGLYNATMSYPQDMSSRAELRIIIDGCTSSPGAYDPARAAYTCYDFTCSGGLFNLDPTLAVPTTSWGGLTVTWPSTINVYGVYCTDQQPQSISTGTSRSEALGPTYWGYNVDWVTYNANPSWHGGC